MDTSKVSDSCEAPTSKRARRSRPTLQSGHECNFVKELPDHLQIECAICLCILQNPHLVDCSCGSHFCKSCLQPIEAERKPCPLCKGKFTKTVLDRHLQRTINELDVYCSFKEAGCEWVGKLNNLSEHLNIDPSNDSHRQHGCPYVPLECSHCKERFGREVVFDHENRDCLKRPVCCEICGEYKSSFEEVTNIHMPLCPSQLVPCPKFCGKSVPLKSVDKHLNENCPFQITECVFSYAGCGVQLLRKDMSTHVGESLAYHLSLQAVSHKELLKKPASMQKEIDDLKEKLREKTLALGLEVEIANDEIHELKDEHKKLCCHVNVLPVHLVLNDFIAKRKAGGIWCSQPFYSRPHGYKMCLKVYTNGRNEAVNTHLSVYIQILPGDFDYQLDWPFTGSVYVHLMDPDNEGYNSTEEIYFDGEILPGSHPQVRMGEKNTESGIDRFITRQTETSYYNWESDSMCFEVSLDEWSFFV